MREGIVATVTTVSPISIDTDLYQRDADGWRDETHYLSLLGPLAVPRAAYIRCVLTRLGRDPLLRALDLGCGGGLVAEEVARLGCQVTGLDPAERSISVARRHAQAMDLPIRYSVGQGESLPFADATFDLVYALDVLEHVRDLARVISEVARVLRPGGIFIYDTLNRTWFSWVVAIGLVQECAWTRLLPRHFHEWQKFITPGELTTLLERYHLTNQELVGFTPRGTLLSLVRLLCQHKRGHLSYQALGAALAERLRTSESLALVYGGYACKRG